MTKRALFQGYKAGAYLKVNQYNLLYQAKEGGRHMIRPFNAKKKKKKKKNDKTKKQT